MAAKPEPRPLPLLLPAALALLAGLWTGLVRLGVPLPATALPPAQLHGPIMVAGFLGTLIGLERAVALATLARQRWAYVSPLASGLGALALVAGLPAPWPQALLVAGAAGLVAIFAVIVKRRPDPPHVVMGAGALALLAGAAALLADQPVAVAAPWWVAFLVLTVAGERLELAHLTARGRRLPASFVAGALPLLAGPLVAMAWSAWGLRLTGAGLLLLGAWLLRHDMARRTIRMGGLARFIAACLLPGYAWLIVAGVLWMLFAADFGGGPRYDAMLHAVMLGFVFSMIFGHAPIILPAVTGARVTYHPRFWIPLGLLHLSVVLRVVGDLAGHASLRRHGGELNVLAVLLFVASTAVALASSRRSPSTATRHT